MRNPATLQDVTTASEQDQEVLDDVLRLIPQLPIKALYDIYGYSRAIVELGSKMSNN